MIFYFQILNLLQKRKGKSIDNDMCQKNKKKNGHTAFLGFVY